MNPDVSNAQAPRTAWYLLGFRICVAALTALLSTAPCTFYKHIHEQPDRRKGKWSVVGHDRPQRRACDQFFAELYMSAAEHLAEQCLDPDNSADAIAQDAEVGGPPESSASSVQAPMVDAAWNPDETLSTEALMVTVGEMSAWPQRFLQHGRLAHLWWQFLAWWQSLHQASSTDCSNHPSWAFALVRQAVPTTVFSTQPNLTLSALNHHRQHG